MADYTMPFGVAPGMGALVGAFQALLGAIQGFSQTMELQRLREEQRMGSGARGMKRA
jgi:hypothetical protein